MGNNYIKTYNTTNCKSEASSSSFHSESEKHFNAPEFAKRIKERRNELGLTQKDLGSITGINTNTIQNYESGAIPKGDYAILLCKALKCSLDWLLTGNGDGPKETDIRDEELRVPDAKPPAVNFGNESLYGFGDAVEDLREIWNSGDVVIMKAIEANLKSFRAAVQTRRQINELRDENKTIKNQLFKIADQLNKHVPKRKKIGEILIDGYNVPEEEIIKALDAQRKNNIKIGEILLEKGIITKECLEDVIIRQADDT